MQDVIHVDPTSVLRQEELTILLKFIIWVWLKMCCKVISKIILWESYDFTKMLILHTKSVFWVFGVLESVWLKMCCKVTSKIIVWESYDFIFGGLWSTGKCISQLAALVYVLLYWCFVFDRPFRFIYRKTGMPSWERVTQLKKGKIYLEVSEVVRTWI